MRVLGIETSCDETGVTLYEQRGPSPSPSTARSPYAEYGGVPELASRDHVANGSIADGHVGGGGFDARDIDAIAYTAGPG
jgi:N6-L-threonylcarbamoyladenine synthase